MQPAALDESLLNFLGALCREIRDGAPELPYGFGNGSFDRVNGTYVQAGAPRGLTCATFVLALFAAYEIDVVDLEEWPPRREDAEWQRSILCTLKAQFPGASDRAYFAHIEADIGNCVRVRPEEVAGAASRDTFPADFATAEALGRQAAAELTRDFLRRESSRFPKIASKLRSLAKAGVEDLKENHLRVFEVILDNIPWRR
ncbi:MAG: hypothetical protein RLO52_19540 [Sandaracinaceae bacterium]